MASDADSEAPIKYPTVVSGIARAYDKYEPLEMEANSSAKSVYGSERAAKIAEELAAISDWWHMMGHGKDTDPPAERNPPVTEFREAVVAILEMMIHKGHDPGNVVEDIDQFTEMLYDQSVDDVLQWARNKAPKDAEVGSLSNVEPAMEGSS